MAGPRRRSRTAPVASSPDHERALLRHDLEVHQEELRAQNQKLIEALHELEETRDRYIELYDGAPNGYCTLDRVGVVREINLTGAALLGQSRAALVGTPLLPSIVAADRGRFLGYLQTSAKGTNEATGGEEVHVHTAQGDRTLQLTCRPRHAAGALVEFFVAMVDVTERRRLEAAREEARREHMELVRRVLTLQEAERRRIARDIHDDLGQQVTALRLKLEWLAAHPADDEELDSRVQRRPGGRRTRRPAHRLPAARSPSRRPRRAGAPRGAAPDGRRLVGDVRDRRPRSAPSVWTPDGCRTRSKRRPSVSCRRR